MGFNLSFFKGFSKAESGFAIWISFGVLICLLGMQLLPTNKLYHQLVQFFFWLPGFLYISLYRSQSIYWKGSLQFVFFIFLLYSVFSIFWGGKAGLIKNIFYVALSANAFMVLTVIYGDRVWQLIANSALLGGFFALLGVVDFYCFKGMSLSERVIGPGVVDHTILGSHLMGSLFFILLMLKDKLPNNLRGVCFFISVLGYVSYLFMSKSKGTLLAFVIGVGFFFFVVYGRKAVYITLLFFLAIFLYVLLFPDFALRGGFSYRPEVWLASINIFLEKPLLGFGIGYEYQVSIPSLTHAVTHAHNFYLNLAIQLGAIGLLIWLILQLSMLRIALKSFYLSEGKALVALMLFSIISLQTDGKDAWVKPNETWFTVWLPVFLALMLSVRNNTRGDQSVGQGIRYKFR